jgi:predicted SnoaL-like aldol condensation-catalyzing enzyme
MASSRKASAELFLQLACSDVARAYAELTTAGFRHHNVWFPPDAESLKRAMQENLQKHPDKQIAIKQSLEEGDRVAVLSHVTFGPGDRGYALAHFFRFEGERIAELWDLAQEIPEDSPNTSGPF